MKAVYKLKVRSGVAVPVPSDAPELVLGLQRVQWEADAAGHLSAVALEFSGEKIRFNGRCVVMSTHTELENKAYRLANYIANRIYDQTGYDAINAEDVLMGSPNIFAETPAEEAILNTKSRTVWGGITLTTFVAAPFEPSMYGQGFDHSPAWSFYADAQRAASAFQRFELLYKVVEYFFEVKKKKPTGPNEPDEQDIKVAAHMASIDDTYTAHVVMKLRQLRNRSAHPHANHGHVNPENPVHVREVEMNLPTLKKLATLILGNPPP
jgi:hypothetical protein